MKKAPALITIAIILVAGALIIFFYGKKPKPETDAWQLIAPGSLGVLETHQPTTLKKLGVDTADLIGLINALSRSRKLNGPYLFSFQSTGKQIEWVAILPKGFPSPLDTLKTLGKSLNERNYEGKSLYDLRNGTAPWATFANVGGLWVASQNSLLVEEIVRRSQHPANNFKTANGSLFNLSTVKQDDGNLYLNWSAVASQISRAPGSERTRDFTHSLVLDLKWSDQSLQGNGFAVDTVAFSTLLSTFAEQKPVTSELRKLIPDQFDSAVQLGFSNSQLWFANRDKVYFNGGEKTPSVEMEKTFGFSLVEFARAVDDEMMFFEFGDQYEVIIIELKEITRAQTQMDKVRRAVKTDRESYADRTIYTVQKESVFAPVVLPFDLRSPHTSYAFDENLLLISTGTRAIKKFIDFRDKELTIGKSIGWSKFLETTLRESNVSVLINKADRSTSPVIPTLTSILPVERASIQFYALEGNYYSSALIQFAGSGSVVSESTKPEMMTMKLADKVVRGPWLVRNHAERRNEVMLQDATFQVMCFDQAGETRWKRSLKAAISTGVYEIDYLRNGKVQYLFCTPGEMHLIDRLGNYVKGFPRKIDMDAPDWLSVVDYDKNRNYRMVLADKHGTIQIMDKDARLLEGWQKKSIGQEFTDAPTHYRIERKDYFVAMTKHGQLHVFNRKGEVVSPFPLQMSFIPGGDVFCDGKQISVVSEAGMLTKLNPAGKKEVEEPLLKNIAAARFKLVASEDRQDFIVIRMERGNLAVFDSSGAMKFEVVNPLSDLIEIQYYKFSGSKGAIVVSDPDQNLACILSMSGKMIVSRPMATAQAPLLDYEPDSGMLTVIINEEGQLGFLKVGL